MEWLAAAKVTASSAETVGIALEVVLRILWLRWNQHTRQFSSGARDICAGAFSALNSAES